MYILNQCQSLGNCTPTPPLTQKWSTDNKFGLILDSGRGRCAVSPDIDLDLFWQSSDINFFGIFHSGQNQFSSSRPFHSCVLSCQAFDLE